MPRPFRRSLKTTTSTYRQGELTPYPDGFATKNVETNGATIHTRVGGRGPAVVLLHGYGVTGDSWAPLATTLADTHTVIVPDLRGFGRSSKPEDGYDKKTQAGDVAGVLDALGVARAALVTHDMGGLVGFAFAAQQRDRVTRWVALDGPLPGIGPWDRLTNNPRLWHFGFGGPDMERLVAGRERLYLDHFWNDFSADPAAFGEAMRAHYAARYGLPSGMRAAFAQFAAFAQDAADNRGFLAAGKLAVPVLAVGGEASSGALVATLLRPVADQVAGAVVPAAGHWLMEEHPAATVTLVQHFLA